MIDAIRIAPITRGDDAGDRCRSDRDGGGGNGPRLVRGVDPGARPELILQQRCAVQTDVTRSI